MKARLKLANGGIKTVDAKIIDKDNKKIAYLEKETFSKDVEYVDFLYDYFVKNTGDEGYFITDMCLSGTAQTFFKEREDTESVEDFSFVTCYGMNEGKTGILAIITGMQYDFGMVVGVNNNVYYTYPRFYIDCDMPYDDIRVEFYNLSDGSYSAMARKYREYKLSTGCLPLKERAAKDSRLKKAADSIEVRIRQGWKPAPSPVENQTPETEPEMHVACNFDRVGDISKAFKKEGVKDAEFCLVGWNIGGHDGRFPQIFPVDERLGGEEKLKKLIKNVKNDGYGIVCHDDATAAYTIADCFDKEYLLKNKDGALHARPYCWSGGRPYKICPQRQYEKFETENQKKIKALGFEGIHYIDVITILPLLKCYDKNHPTNRKESADWYRKTMQLARETFGGFSSESGYDFAAEYLDYSMYSNFAMGKDEKIPMSDEIVPFWHLVYHGIILYNPCTFTLNYPAKGEKNRLKLIELGGRPLICYYANFATDNQWMGAEDFLCDTDEQLEQTAKWAKQMWSDYDELSDIRYEFMENHEKISDGIYKTTYSNGTSVTVDYNNETYKIERKN